MDTTSIAAKPSSKSESARTASPLAGAAVTVIGGDGKNAGSTTTGADGSYTLKAPGNATYVVKVISGNIVLKAIRTFGTANTTVNVNPGTTVTVAVLERALNTVFDDGITFGPALSGVDVNAAVTQITTLPGYTPAANAGVAAIAANTNPATAASTVTTTSSTITYVAVPAAPAGVSAAAGNGQVTVSWTAVTGAASYSVYYRTSAGVTAANGTKAMCASANCTITGLANGTTHYFVVAAVNAGGEGAVSSEVSVTPQNAGTWSTKAAKPVATGLLTGAAELNGKIYAIGGATWGTTTAISTVEIYDPVTDTWSTGTSMPTARWGHVTIVVNGKIYAIGGWNGTSFLTTVEMYDPVANTWTTKAAMSTARYYMGVAQVNGVIYVVGGYNSGGNLATVEAYDTATNTWSTKTSLPIVARENGVSAVNGVIYSIGGYGATGYLTAVYAYDPTTNAWTVKTAMPTARNELGTAVVNGIIYAIGGATTSNLSTVEAYDPVANTWSTKTSMPTARYGLSTVSVNGVIYAIAGSANGVTNEAYVP